MQAARWEGSAAAFHARSLPDPITEPLVWTFAVERPALVLGGAQRDDVVDAVAAREAGVEVVRRRSGGGAVLLEPGAALWVDVVLPRDDDRWDDDVSHAARWLGAAWAGALADVGVAGAEVHDGALQRTAWGRLVCFAAVGPGEVTVGGRKAVGISQRRTRRGARFQSVALASWQPEAVLRLLALSQAERVLAADALAHVATGAGVPLDRLREALLTRLG